jgi:hypothetical protein
LKKQLPIGIEVSATLARYYIEVCDAWEGGEYNDIEMAEMYPGLSQSSACTWTVVGYTVQQSITVEDMWLQIVHLIQRLYLHIDVLEGTVEAMYQSSLDTQEALKGQP